MNTKPVKLTKTIYSLEGNGIEICVEFDKEYKTVESILYAHAVTFDGKKNIDLTDVLVEHLGLDAIVDKIDWWEVYRAETEDKGLYSLGRDAMKQAAQQTHY